MLFVQNELLHRNSIQLKLNVSSILWIKITSAAILGFYIRQMCFQAFCSFKWNHFMMQPLLEVLLQPNKEHILKKFENP
jgi:hypothetical protein